MGDIIPLAADDAAIRASRHRGRPVGGIEPATLVSQWDGVGRQMGGVVRLPCGPGPHLAVRDPLD